MAGDEAGEVRPEERHVAGATPDEDGARRGLSEPLPTSSDRENEHHGVIDGELPYLVPARVAHVSKRLVDLTSPLTGLRDADEPSFWSDSDEEHTA
ncbi:MAG: hypothetical protein KDB35_17500, partial [Acidimicrobiales bacterium]|nr:hypothetical protein [Acidimicrobiales bacterium]